MPVVPTIILNNGYHFPALGLGTYKADPSVISQAVQDAIDAGYRHVDCAYFYGNEAGVGDGINAKISDGTVKREDLFITTKLWNNTHSKNTVVPACKKSLQNLKLEYIDLYLIHWPVGFKEGGELTPVENGIIQTSDVDYTETWEGMEDCVSLGLAKSIGLSNFNSQQIDRILSVCKIKPVNNQIECNPNINQRKLIEYCKKLDITVTAFCPLGKAAEAKSRTGCPAPSMENPDIIKYAEKYKKTPAQVVLRYLYQHGAVPIPKSVTKSRIIENIDIFNFELSTDEMKTIDGLDCGMRIAPFTDCKSHKYYPFGIEF